MVNTAVQLFILEGPLTEKLESVANAGFDGVELFWKDHEEALPNEVCDALKKTGLGVAGVHIDINRLEDAFDATVDYFTSVGCDTFVIPYLDEQCFESRDSILETAARLMDIADQLEERNARLLYHNHRHEFHQIDGMTALEVLIQETNEQVALELDIGLASRAGNDPLVLLNRLEGSVPIVHVKDGDEAKDENVPLGEGDTDISGCIRVAQEGETKWFVYEGVHEVDTLKGAYQTIEMALQK